jgi:ketosteroid isomerase-like protein
MLRVMLLAMAVLCVPCAALGAPARTHDPVIDQLTKLNATLQAATKNYDVETLKSLITDDYELVSASGKVYDRAAFLADAADRSAVYEINQPEDVTVRHYDVDCAIVTAVLHVRYRIAAKTVDVRIRYADVWMKLGGQWRYAFGEASPLKK